ncbi:MAG: alpha/beta fold hydrolase [Actinomycetota bacterium]|nr:alpha/beta fold hydrolase [Actinomycetota bacterium]
MASRAIVYRRALTSYARRYVFVPQYRQGQRLALTTADGVRLSADLLRGPPDAPATVVLVHGFALSSRTPKIHAFANLLAHDVNVVVPDLRGHGRSGGRCTLGDLEPLDVAAAVEAAPPGLPVVTMGVSLGGAAVLLHGGTLGGVAGVVAISAPAWSNSWDTRPTERIRRHVSSRGGRLFLSSVLRTRVAADWRGVPESRDIAAAIAPAFTIVVHDPDDHYFGEEHARTLYEWLRPPKDLWLIPDSGHGTDLLTPQLAARLLGRIRSRLQGP